MAMNSEENEVLCRVNIIGQDMHLAVAHNGGTWSECGSYFHQMAWDAWTRDR